MSEHNSYASSSTEFEEGRYLYCVVRTDGSTLAVEGIEDGEVSIIEHDGIGAVVQPVDSMFDSDDLTEVKRWLLSHQRVIDAAGETFDTPIPFRFDTIVTGDDGRVREWIEDHTIELNDALESLSGRWEYRIELRWNESAVREGIAAEDEELADLEARIEEASEGTGYLIEKQYDQRLSEQVNGRRSDLAGTLYERIADHADAIETVDSSSTLLEASGAEGAEDEFETVVQLSLLAAESSEGPIGDVLEEFVGKDEFDVRYTGPWPPYSHAPTIGSGGDER